jgi:chitinase
VQLSTLGLNPTVIAGSPFPLVAIVSDGDGNVSNLQLFVNGSTGAFYSQGGPTQNTPIIIQYTPPAAGRYNVYAVVTDDTGNTAVSAPIVINVTGNTAPTAVLVRPNDDSTVTTVGTPVFLEATASDPDIGQTVSVTFINTLTGQTLATGTRVGLTDTYRAIWTPNQANTYSVAARSADNVGGSTTSTASRRVVVDNVVGIAPTISINVPTSASTASTASFVATASDSDGSVVGVEFFMNRISIGQAVRDQQTNTWRLVANYAGVDVGTVEVVALARDSSGNVAASRHDVRVSVGGPKHCAQYHGECLVDQCAIQSSRCS